MQIRYVHKNTMKNEPTATNQGIGASPISPSKGSKEPIKRSVVGSKTEYMQFKQDLLNKQENLARE